MSARRSLAGRGAVALVAVLAVLGSVVVASETTPGPAVPAAPSVTEAPDAASAAFAARRQGSRVEVTSERTETRTTFANPDGGLTSEVSAVPTRVRRADGWVPVDTTLVTRADGLVEPKAALGGLALSGGGAEAPLATLTKDGKTLTVRWPGELPKPVLAGNRATYPGVLPGVDLVMLAERSGYQQQLVIKDAGAARNPALAAITMRIAAEGVRVSVDGSGGLRAVDSAGTPVFAAPPSVMWDSSDPDAPRTANVGVAVDGDTLTLRPDPAFLADPATVYPVVVDPNWRDFGKWGWATVLSGKPNDEYWWTSGEHPWAQVGQCYQGNPNRCNAIGEAWAYFQYDTSFLNGRQILEAAFNTTVVHSPNCGEYWHQLFMAERGIDSGTNWNNRPQGWEVNGRWAPASWDGCPGWKPAGFSLWRDGRFHINAAGMSTYFLKAANGDDQAAWRKYNPDSTILVIKHNLAPSKPYELHTDPPLRAACYWCEGIPFVGDANIRLKARLSDPDNDMVDPQWHIYTNGVREERGWGLGFQVSGALHDTNLDLTTKRDGDWIDWYVRGGDGYIAGDWERSPHPYYFRVDRTGVPVPPTVVSAQYPEDNAWHGAVGAPGAFTFGANGISDVDHYLYWWTGGPTQQVNASALGGPATVTLAPNQDGPQTLNVESVDRAGHRSPTRSYRTYVRGGNGPLAQWSFEGNANDTAFLGDRHGTLNGGTNYTPGSVGTALQLDGVSGTHMTARNTVRTDASFSVSAWVKLDRVDGHRYTVISQDGTAAQGFFLQYEGDKGRWVFAFPHSDVAQIPDWYFVESPHRPVAGQWIHLAGTYDSASRQVRLYVNGEPVGARTRHTEWHTPGLLRIGNLKVGTGLHNHWPGAIDEVQVHDRVLSTAEVKAAVSRDNVALAHWRFNETRGTTARNSVEGGQAALLANGATFAERRGTDYALRLDGGDDHAVTTGPVVRTDQSFTVAALVNAKEFVTDGKSMTAVSQDGNRNSGFYLQYNSSAKGPGAGGWVFMRFTTDDDSPRWIGAVASQQPLAGDWVHLAGVYDAPTRELRVYVNGELGATTQLPAGTAWDAKGPLAIGRGRGGAGPVDPWNGMIDDVRLYNRVLAVEELQGLISQSDVTAGSWKLDNSTTDDSGQGRHGKAEGNPGWTAGQTSLPNPADLAILLDGTDDHVHAPSTVDTSGSFSVTAWVRPDKPESWSAAVSQDGVREAGFSLTAGADGKWHWFVGTADQTPPPGDWLVAGSVQYQVWTHIAAVSNQKAQQLELYINGVRAGAKAHTAGFAARGELQIGRARWNGAYINYFAGAIDDVAVHSRPLFAEEIRAMAGRDLTLVHNWRLDEGSGATTADAVGSRTGTLRGRVTREPGRLGNAVGLNGTDGSVDFAGVDLRTDRSFTLATWVYLDPAADCPAGEVCRSDAVSVDGGARSKVRLGHVYDDDQAPRGKWIFEMPEQNGTVTDAALSVDPGELREWVHLVGVYDQPTRKIWLYVNGNRVDDGTLNTPWPTSGALHIGRSTVDGSPTGFWRGAVDDVRLYTSPFEGNWVGALYASYPAGAAAPVLPTPDAGHWKFDEKRGTTFADGSTHNRTATVRGAPEDQNKDRTGGRTSYSSWPEGVRWAETAGPVLDTSKSFSVSTWVFLTYPATGSHTAVAQDGQQVSSFLLQYHGNNGKWAVVAPGADQRDPASTLVSSIQPATMYVWTHLAMVYDAGLQQLKLFVNGGQPVARTGVSMWNATGPLTIGRSRWNGANADLFGGGVDEVQAFGRALTDGEVRKIHDEVPVVAHGAWQFEGTARDVSWRDNPTTLSGGTSYVPGVRGQALRLDGTGSATGEWIAANMADSFTFSAWAKLFSTDRDATVLAQDGSRMSALVLQYNNNVDRWVFGGPNRDADDAQLVYAYSKRAPKPDEWVHLSGVYDVTAQQLRLYVNGELEGTRDAVVWPGWGQFTIGRGKVNGAPASHFPGVLDEIHTDLGIPSADELRRRGTYPAPAGGQLGRFVNALGDHYTANSVDGHEEQFAPVPAGYRYEGPLGKLLPTQQSNTRPLYACFAGTDEFSSMDADCEGFTRASARELGWIYTEPPPGMATIPVYRCRNDVDHYDSVRADCEGGITEFTLGYSIAYAALVRYVYHHPEFEADHSTTVYGTSPGYRWERTYGLVSMTAQPGTHSLYACRDGRDEFASLDSACGGKTMVASMGRVWTDPPPGVASLPIYACHFADGQRFVSVRSDCEGGALDQPLGHILREVPPPAPAN